MSVLRSGKVKRLAEKWGKKGDLNGRDLLPCLTPRRDTLRLLLLVENAMPAFHGGGCHSLTKSKASDPDSEFRFVQPPTQRVYGSWLSAVE